MNHSEPNIPDGHWHLSIKSPDGYGFDLQWDHESEVVEMLRTLIECSKEPGGIAKDLELCVKQLTRPTKP